MRATIAGLPPTTNNLYAVVRGRNILSEAGRAAHAAFAAAFRNAGAVVAEGPVALSITYHLGAYDRDVDGSHKVVVDAGKGLLYRDDRQVALLAIEKRRAAPGVLPWTEVVVRALAAAPAFAEPPLRAGALSLAADRLPPSTNNAYAAVNGIRRATREAKEAKAAFAAAFVALLPAGSAQPHFAGPVAVRIRYGFQADRRDVDGSHKLLLDAARGVLWADDRQIRRIRMEKARAPEGAPAVVVDVRPLPAAPAPVRGAARSRRPRG
jgi:Holliday junction resolvase RusA-like endonuclease